MSDRGASEHIEAFVGFSKHDAEPVTADETAAPGYPDNRIGPVRCRIENARRADDISFDKHGFTLASHVTAFADERDEEVLNARYQAELAGFLKEHFKASLVVPNRSGVVVRYGLRLVGRAPNDDEDPTRINHKIPASFAHIDIIPSSITRDTGRTAMAGDRRYSRMIHVMTWRAVSPPPQDVPLALCDSRTVKNADIVVKKGFLPDRKVGIQGELMHHFGGLHFSADQKWYYYPSMTADEVLLMRGFDTADPDASRVAHAAFDNRDNDPQALPRESLEARFLVYFD